MTTCGTTVVAIAVLTAAVANAQPLVISRAGSRPVNPAPAQNFTGAVQVEMLFEAVDPSHASGGSVTFAAGARTAWHSHPRGQVLFITAGTGRVQRWGDAIHEVHAGDLVRIPPNQKHWHGAAPTASMTHLAISEHRDGQGVQWMEHVSDEQYNRPVTPRSGEAAPAAPPGSASAQPAPAGAPVGSARPSGPLQQKVAPGMATLTDDVLYGDVWRRPGLSPRDRSLVTITALIAMGRTAPLAGHLTRALDNGLTPREASGLLAHLAVYCGWPNAVSALDAYDQVYTVRKVDTEALSTRLAEVERLPARAADTAWVESAAGAAAIAPKFAQLTRSVVIDDLWRRSDLALRDRSLVTIVALAAMGDDDQLEFYLRRGRDSDLTSAQVAEALTHLAFYAGWGKATNAIAAATKVWGQ